MPDLYLPPLQLPPLPRLLRGDDNNGDGVVRPPSCDTPRIPIGHFLIQSIISVYKYFHGFSGAGEVYKYFSGAGEVYANSAIGPSSAQERYQISVYINTSPALEKCIYIHHTLFRRR